MIAPYITALAALLGSIPALLGVLITARTQTANQKLNNQTQAKLAQDKARNDALTAQRETTLSNLAVAHKILSQIAREFSVTGLDIMWTASMPVDEFNKKYLLLCEKADELLMIVDFHAQAASEVAHELYGQMNMFWGNFKNLLYQTEKGKTPNELQHVLSQTHEAARQIGDRARVAKYRLSDVFKNQIPN